MTPCKQCGGQFEIRDIDREFYRKMDVPEPIFCIDCRQQVRLMWRNERNLYARKCVICGSDTLAVYHPDSPYRPCCTKCFYGDACDATEYGKTVDFSRPFFEQFAELLVSVPHLALIQVDNENCTYANFTGKSKNCYLTSAAWMNEDCYYSHWLFNSKNCVDCHHIYQCELCYECSDCEQCYRTFYSRNSAKCTDSYFLDNCTDCTKCFGCANMKHKTLYAFNKPVTEQEYAALVKEARSFSGLKRILERARAHRLTLPHRSTITSNTIDSQGCYLSNSKHCIHSFDVNKGEDLTYCFDIDNMKECMDIDYQQDGDGNYQLINGVFPNRCRWVVTSINTSYAEYGFELQGCDRVFGGVGLRNKRNAILNTVYTEQEYDELRGKLIHHMKETGEWGQFFPPNICVYSYNESLAHEQLPMDKATCEARGWKWCDAPPTPRGKGTVDMSTLADSIDAVDDALCSEVLTCEESGMNFKLTKSELAFYKRNGIPLPRLHPTVRHIQRMRGRTPRKLWHRQCMCEKADHGHAGCCPTEFETTYSPERSELVYCEQCYQKEIV